MKERQNCNGGKERNKTKEKTVKRKGRGGKRERKGKNKLNIIKTGRNEFKSSILL